MSRVSENFENPEASTFRVMFLVRSLGRGGAERQVLNLAAGMRARGWQVFVACFYTGGEMQSEFEQAEITVVDLAKGGRWDFLRFLLNLRRTIRAISPDIVHSYLAGPNLILAICNIIGSSPKIVWGIRNSHAMPDRYDLFLKAISFLEAKLSRVPDLIISNSSAGRSICLERGFPDEKTIVIPNGIDTDKYSRDRAEQSRFRVTQEISDDKFLVGMVARVNSMKGHDVFIKAAAVLSQESPDWHFVCVGNRDSDFARSMANLTDRLNLTERISWVDVQQDVESVYTALNVFVSASHDGEGFSNSIAEAMACECPCVATDVGDAAIILGDNGILISPGNVSALVESLRTIRSKEPTRIDAEVRLGRERIISQFNIDGLVQNSVNALEAVI